MDVRPDPETSLAQPCIADTSLLSNFVHTGYAYLLHRLLPEPVLLSPTVLDPAEVLLPRPYTQALRSEFLRPLHMASLPGYEDYQAVAPLIQGFVLGSGHLWRPVELTSQEAALAYELSEKRAWDRCRDSPGRYRRRRVGPGEAEAAAVAVCRGWTLLADDQAIIDLLRCLYPQVPVVRTCALLQAAARSGHVPCVEAAHLFNEVLPGRGFYVRKGEQVLRLRCGPPCCAWEGPS